MAPAIIVPAGRAGGPPQIAGLVAGGGGGTPMSIVTASTGEKYITTTWTHAPTDNQKATIAYWQKFISGPSGSAYNFTTGQTNATTLDHQYSTPATFYEVNDDSSSAYAPKDNTGSSPGATNWHHVCIQIDTAQATAADRVKFWLDGVDLGSQGTAPAQNSNMQITANGIASYIGQVWYQIGNPTPPDAKFAYFYLIDGQALTPSSFTTGTGASCHPIAFGGTYGANGFFLNGNGSTLADQSGNGNNWTAPNGITYSADLPT